MAQERTPIDISNIPELVRLAEEVRESGEPRVLRRADQDLALLAPLAQKSGPRARARRQRASQASPLGNIVGLADRKDFPGVPPDVSSNKHKYLAEAYDAGRS